MRKEYIVPSAEIICVEHATNLLEGSYNDHADSKLDTYFEEEADDIEVIQMPKNRNLWEE